MTTILIICIPITSLVVGFLVLKAVHLGLRWQVEVKQEQVPTMKPLPNPITPIVEAIQEKKQAKQGEETKSIFDEWVNGEKKSR